MERQWKMGRCINGKYNVVGIFFVASSPCVEAIVYLLSIIHLAVHIL